MTQQQNYKAKCNRGGFPVLPNRAYKIKALPKSHNTKKGFIDFVMVVDYRDILGAGHKNTPWAAWRVDVDKLTPRLKVLAGVAA